jgi:hypothetical protein
VSNSHDEESRRNDMRRRIAEELIASELRRRQRKRIDAALLDAARDPPADADAASRQPGEAPRPADGQIDDAADDATPAPRDPASE